MPTTRQPHGGFTFVCQGTVWPPLLPPCLRPSPCRQVHEKSILLPLLPLAVLLGREQPHLLCWVNAMAVFSMVPLLKKDGLALAAAAATAACHAAIQLASVQAGSSSSGGGGKKGRSGGSAAPLGALPERWVRVGGAASLAVCAAVLAASATLPPPPRLPFLYDALTVTWAFAHFAALFAYTNWLQLLEFRAAAAAVGPAAAAGKRSKAKRA